MRLTDGLGWTQIEASNMDRYEGPAEQLTPRDDRIDKALKRFRELFPEGEFGPSISKEEEEAILGFGPDGV